MGKSSLMIRTAEVLIEEGIKPVIIDLTELGADTTADQWYRGFLEKVAEQLELQTAIGAWWDANQHLSFAQRFNGFMSDLVVQQARGPIVVFIDEIDTTLRLDFTDDFLHPFDTCITHADSEAKARQLEQTAEENGNKSRTYELISSSLLSQNSDPEMAVLAAALSVETASRYVPELQPEAETQLHNAILASHVRLTLDGHNNYVLSVAWSQDGTRLATGSTDRTAKVWDAATGKVVLTLSGHDVWV